MQYAAKAGAAPLYAGPWDCVKKVYQQLGMSKGIYRGWAPVALCRMMNWSYFGGYQYFKQMALQRQQHATGATMPSVLSLSGSVFAGGMAGTCYWMSCYPLDVLKARLLAAPDVQPPVYRGIAHAAQTIYHQQGIKGFFEDSRRVWFDRFRPTALVFWLLKWSCNCCRNEILFSI